MRIAHSVESHLVVSVIGRHCGHRSGHHGDSRERGGGRVIEVALACAVPGGSVEAGAAAAESLDSGGAAEGAAPGGGGLGDGGAVEAAAVAAESIHGAGPHSPATQSGPWLHKLGRSMSRGAPRREGGISVEAGPGMAVRSQYGALCAPSCGSGEAAVWSLEGRRARAPPGG